MSATISYYIRRPFDMGNSYFPMLKGFYNAIKRHYVGGKCYEIY